MRKHIALTLVLVIAALFLASCGNKDVFDTVYTYHEAVIAMPDGTVVSGEVQSWHGYEGDLIQVKIDGITYLVHSSDIVLMNIP
jgi:hypothetical protein